MPSLHDIQRRFADALFSPEAAIDFVAGASMLARDRIAIYRRTICANYRKALAATYPVVKRLTGSSFFHAAVDDFVNERPSRSGDLNIYGQDFGDFLDKYAPAEDLPYLGDVARLEWAIDEAPRAADRSRTPDSVLASLAAARPEHLPSLRLELHPSCRLVASPYPIMRIWQTNQPAYEGDDRVMLDESADRLLVRRGVEGVPIERLSAGDHAWLAALRDGKSLGASIEAAQNAEATFDLGASLREHIAAGTIVAVIDR